LEGDYVDQRNTLHCHVKALKDREKEIQTFHSPWKPSDSVDDLDGKLKVPGVY
jgi:hypothetical protein